MEQFSLSLIIDSYFKDLERGLSEKGRKFKIMFLIGFKGVYLL